jgi:membrane dipeptidase
MRFFDAHCDTVKPVTEGVHDFRTGVGTGQVSLPGLLSIGSCAQVLACCVPSRDSFGREPQAAEQMIEAVRRLVAESGDHLVLVLTADQLREVCGGERIAILIGLEGADPLQGKANALRRFGELGVRSIMPAWSDNDFAGSAFGRNTPLTAAGEKLVAMAEELRIVVDVSHLSDQAFAGVCRIATAPFIASHSNCRSLCDSPRNLTDAMIREVADRGGVMGINLYSGFVDPDYLEKYDRPNRETMMKAQADSAESKSLQRRLSLAPRPSLDWVARHVVHAIRVGGEDCIGLGGDLDGSPNLPEGLDSIGDYNLIVAALERAKLSAAQVEKVCYRNFLRVYCDVLPKGAGT